MERITGIGGVFFRSRGHKRLAAWYSEHLGIPVEEGQPYATLRSAASDEQTIWSTFPSDTKYFGPGEQSVMINYRVRNLDLMLAQLRAAGVAVEERVEDSEFGRFGWAVDPEGSRFEIWEPPAAT